MILVTGASGHLGANLVRRLLADGHEVQALLWHPGDGIEALAELPVRRVIGDLRDPEMVAAAVEGCERVYHCAARVRTSARGQRETYAVNVLGTRNLLQAARDHGVHRVVVTGSFGASSPPPGRPGTEGDLHNPFERQSPYERTKALMEHEACKAAAQGLEVVITLPTAIIGPHDYGPSRLGRVLLDQAHGRLAGYVSGGFEFVSVEDLVQGHVLAMERGLSGHRYLLSTEFCTLDRLLELFAQVTGQPKPRRQLPARAVEVLARLVDVPRAALAPEGESRLDPSVVRLLRSERHADCSLAQAALGYRPTSIARAVEQAYRCFVDRGLVPRRRTAKPPPRSGGGARSEGVSR